MRRQVHWRVPPSSNIVIRDLCGPPTIITQVTSNKPRSSNSPDERRPSCSLHQQKPEFESQPDLVFNTVIILNVLKTHKKIVVKKFTADPKVSNTV